MNSIHVVKHCLISVVGFIIIICTSAGVVLLRLRCAFSHFDYEYRYIITMLKVYSPFCFFLVCLLNADFNSKS